MCKRKLIAFVLLVVPLFPTIVWGGNKIVNQVLAEKQPIADQGNGYYRNPIISGNYGDPSIVRVDKDYYMAFSRGNGFIIWHSKDIVNWEPVIRQTLPKGYDTVWAVDLQYFNGKFHLYMPILNYPNKNDAGFGNFVAIAEAPEGPWSDPIDIEISTPEYDGWGSIDPGFVQTPQGEKYLYTSNGNVVRLNDDGTKAVEKPQKVYDGWKYPDDWNVQCFCLESPKFFMKDGLYYLVSAEGGTNGPSTAHMTVVARSNNPTGPWANSPYNPLVHTSSQDDKWWHQGHGTIFEAADGAWWTVYHARKNGFPELGRSTVLLPVEWTSDGWPIIKNSYNAADLIPMPDGENIGHGLALSDNFSGKKIGLQWNVSHEMNQKIELGDGKLILKATGSNLREASSVTIGAVNESFEVSVELEFNNQNIFAGIALGYDGIKSNGVFSEFSEAPEWRMNGVQIKLENKGKVYMKIKNFQKDLSFFISDDGQKWKSFGKGTRTNESYLIRLFAYGEGSVSFKNFKYQGL